MQRLYTAIQPYMAVWPLHSLIPLDLCTYTLYLYPLTAYCYPWVAVCSTAGRRFAGQPARFLWASLVYLY